MACHAGVAGLRPLLVLRAVEGLQDWLQIKISLALLHELIRNKAIKYDADGEIEDLITKLQAHALPNVLLPSRRSGTVSHSFLLWHHCVVLMCLCFV